MALINRVVLGTRPFTKISEKEAFKILELFFSAGGRYVDTSCFYNYGKVEATIGEFNKLYKPLGAYISKTGYFSNVKDYTNINRINLSVEETCQKLNLIPQYMLLHEADWAVWWGGNQIGKLIKYDSLGQLNFDLYGKFCEVLNAFSITGGISGNNAEIINNLMFLEPKMILLSKQYDLLWKNAQILISNPNVKNFLLILGAPFHQGWLFRLNELSKKFPQIAQKINFLNKIISKYPYSLRHIALNFVLQATECQVVFGVESAEELDENLKAINNPLPTDLIEELKKIAVILPPMPGPLVMEGISKYDRVTNKKM